MISKYSFVFLKMSGTVIQRRKCKRLESKTFSSAEELSTFILDGNVEFPFKKLYISENDLENVKNRLLNYKLVYDKDSCSYNNARNFVSKEFGDKNLFNIVSPFDEYFEINRITDYFTEQNRLSALTKDSLLTPLQFWKDEYSVKLLVRFMWEKGVITSHEAREQIYCLSDEATQFKVTLARFIYEHFQAKNILDISAGWGDRLIGALTTSSVQSYTGYDPNSALKKGHDEIIEYFGENKKAQIIYEPFEKAKLEQIYDTVLSSPPYYDMEVYTSEKGQSIMNKNSLKQWFKEFLLVSVENAWNSLISKGHLILHLENSGNIDMVEKTNQYIKTLKGSNYLGVIFSMNTKKNGELLAPRPLWVWQKE